MAKKKSDSSSSEKGDLLHFLRKVNRPYSANDMCTHLQGRYTKTTLSKALDKLIDQDLVVSKTFGKSVIYTIKQENPTEEEDDQSLDKEISSTTEKLDQLKEENRRRQQALAKLKSLPKTDDAKTQLEGIRTSMLSLKQQLDEFKSKGIVQISPEERQRIDKELTSNRKLWSQRRKLFKEILGAMMENMPLKKDELLEEIDFQDDPIPFEKDPLAP
ncbi:Tat binding protein 1-interacting protein-domain-containing protein [Absidia repens]|uniref:Homologous-pairing protein 2 homolog n=1 Tax=Absidia repens TaxID=90262 RepID=A0A1X2IT77_9FUNG|nr:Tat binding protein 1-interacting protein-domain-containing protein [Absidia repens]